MYYSLSLTILHHLFYVYLPSGRLLRLFSLLHGFCQIQTNLSLFPDLVLCGNSSNLYFNLSFVFILSSFSVVPYGAGTLKLSASATGFPSYAAEKPVKSSTYGKSQVLPSGSPGGWIGHYSPPWKRDWVFSEGLQSGSKWPLSWWVLSSVGRSWRRFTRPRKIGVSMSSDTPLCQCDWVGGRQRLPQSLVFLSLRPTLRAAEGKMKTLGFTPGPISDRSLSNEFPIP